MKKCFDPKNSPKLNISLLKELYDTIATLSIGIYGPVYKQYKK